jgi:LDH2 family malate/lactate/ureidoglycolate dehydrogenase
MTSAAATRVPADDLSRFASLVLEKTGLSHDDAAFVAEQLVWRDLREEYPHGLTALPSCLAAFANGKADPRARCEIVNDTSALTVIDAHGASGMVSASFAMRHATERASRKGIGLAVVRDSRTASVMGYYPTLAIAAGMVGLAITNSEPLQAPWGGTTKVLGNQAFALGAPASRHNPLLHDGAATATSRARINDLARRGLPLPEGAALDVEGRPTTDPAAALEGLLLPSGGHKGYAVSVFWEVLTAALAGGGRGRDPHDNSLFLLAIDPAASVGRERFIASVDDLIDRIHDSPPQAGVDRVYAPGERGYITAADRAKTGIPISAARIAELAALGERVGVAW